MKFTDIEFKPEDRYARQGWTDDRYITFHDDEHVQLDEVHIVIRKWYERMFNRRGMDRYTIKSRIDMIIPDTLEMMYNWRPSVEDAKADDWYKLEMKDGAYDYRNVSR